MQVTSEGSRDSALTQTGIFRHVAKVILWFKTPEHVLVFDMDIIIVAWTFLAGIMMEKDQAATTQAYIPGMREHLNFLRNDLVEFNTYSSIEYALGLVPGQLI